MSKHHTARSYAHFTWAMRGSGAVESFIARSSEALLAQGHEVFLATTEPCNLPLPAGLRLVTGKERTLRGRLASPGLAVRLRRSHPDVVHVHGLDSRTGALHAAGRWTRLWSPSFQEGVGRAHSAEGWRTALRSILDVHPNVVFVSEAEREAFIEFTGRQPRASTVITPGPGWSDGRGPSRRRPGNLVLAEGRLILEKRFDLVVEVAARAGQLDQLRIIGEGPMEAELRFQVEHLGGDPDTVIRGVRSEQDVVALLSRAAVVVSMSEGESFGSSVWDGLLAGCGLVVTDLACHREVVARRPTDRVRFVGIGDVDGAAQALAEVLSLDGDRNPAADMPRWSGVAEQLLAFADEVKRRGR